MQVPIRRIGNSQGVIIPRPLLQQVGIESDVDLEVIDGAIVLRPLKSHPRTGWEAAFQRATEAGDQPDNDMFDSVSNNFDQTDWQW